MRVGVVVEVPGLSGETPHINGEIPSIEGECWGLIVESPRLNRDTQNLIVEVLSINGEIPALNGQTRRLNEEIPNINVEVWSLNGEIPSINIKLQNLNLETQRLNDETQILNGEISRRIVVNHFVGEPTVYRWIKKWTPWIIWEFTGLRFIWRKILPEEADVLNGQKYRKPSTFLWSVFAIQCPAENHLNLPKKLEMLIVRHGFFRKAVIFQPVRGLE